jgi:hypothetical protein
MPKRKPISLALAYDLLSPGLQRWEREFPSLEFALLCNVVRDELVLRGRRGPAEATRVFTRKEIDDNSYKRLWAVRILSIIEEIASPG